MTFTDTHTHLFSDQFKEDIQTVLEQTKAQQVHRMILPCIDTSDVHDMIALWENNQDCMFLTKGLHPCSVKENWESELQAILQATEGKKVVAIGECGLDFYWDTTFQDQQEACLRAHIALADQENLPIILHCRDSVDRTIEILEEEYKQHPIKGVFHCFSGTAEQAERILSNLPTFMFGIGGPITYKKSKLPAVVKTIPLNQLVIETDSPYLPPVPYRGKRNSSEYIPLIAEKIAEVHEVSVSELSEITEKNVELMFFQN